jgi:hypothetical protein
VINQARKITVDTTITAARVELKRLVFLGLGLLTITMVEKILAEAKLSLDNAASFEDPRMKSIEVGGRQAINYRHKRFLKRRTTDIKLTLLYDYSLLQGGKQLAGVFTSSCWLCPRYPNK